MFMHRVPRGYLIAVFLILIALGSQLSEAQFTASFQTNIISGVTSNWFGDSYDVGNSSNVADLLLIQKSGMLVDGNGQVGYYSTTSNNTVIVSGSGSVWSNAGVSGFVTLGREGSGNRLVISNGGWVIAQASSVGYDIGSSSNSALVTDAGSVWNNSGTLIVGEGTGNSNSLVGNSMTVSNYGQVFDATAYIGSGLSCRSNTVRVVAGGIWQNYVLYVGSSANGSGNSLVVDGGSVYATNLVVGFAGTICDNVLQLDSGDLIVTNNGGGVLEVRHGELIVNGGTLQADMLVITNPCAQFVHTGGTLIVGNIVLDPNTFRIVSVTQQSNNVLVTWMMGPGATNTLQATAGDGSGGYSTNGFTDIFIVTNNTTVGTVTNYLDIGAATNTASRYYRARLVP